MFLYKNLSTIWIKFFLYNVSSMKEHNIPAFNYFYSFTRFCIFSIIHPIKRSIKKSVLHCLTLQCHSAKHNQFIYSHMFALQFCIGSDQFINKQNIRETCSKKIFCTLEHNIPNITYIWIFKIKFRSVVYFDASIWVCYARNWCVVDPNVDLNCLWNDDTNIMNGYCVVIIQSCLLDLSLFK